MLLVLQKAVKTPVRPFIRQIATSDYRLKAYNHHLPCFRQFSYSNRSLSSILKYSTVANSSIKGEKSPFLKQNTAPTALKTPSGMSFRTLADDSAIEKPLLDDRSYRLVVLPNGLHVLAIHDPTTDKAAASLDVHVGAFADRRFEVSGLAHFCEHLLFMGTSKYPEENEYLRYLAQHLGYLNAYTAAEHTNYYFELSADHLEGALDRFSQFFISPLFSQACQDREIRAVDSENKKNLQNDLWRFYQLDKLTSNPDHPYSGFSTGNLHTLQEEPASRGLNVRDVLLDFYGSHYSANLMSLVVLGKESLDTLTQWAVDQFLAVPNADLPRPSYDGKLIYGPSQLGKLTSARPIMDVHKLELVFMIPSDQEAQWRLKPGDYYLHLLGHESKGLILALLKEKNWVSELTSGSMKVCDGSSLFHVEVELTPSGLDNWRAIVVHVFEYLHLILAEPPKEWLWTEISNMSKVNFRFKQKQGASSTVSKMSSKLYRYTENSYIPPKYLLSSSIARDFEPEEIARFGSFLVPENLRLTLSSQTLGELPLREKWYNTEYLYETIPDDIAKSIRNVSRNDSFHLPSPNVFIPEDFSISGPKLQTPLKHPFLIEDSSKFQVWFKQDDQFQVPKGTIEILVHLPSSNKDVESSLYSSLLAELVGDELNNVLYYASLVGLSFTIHHFRDGFLLKFSGYNDKLPVLLEEVLSKFRHFEPRKDRFESLKFKTHQELKNFGYGVPYNQIETHLLTLMNDKTYTYDEKIAKLNGGSITFEKLVDFYKESLFSGGVFGEVLVQGNFNYANAYKVSKQIQDAFEDVRAISGSQKTVNEIVKLQQHVLPANERIRYDVQLQDPKNINSCIDYFIQIADSAENDRLRVLTDLLATIIHEPCFNQLRTKEQLGYVVFSGYRPTRTKIGFRFLVQSERSCGYLEYRIEEFLAKFGSSFLPLLTEEAFGNYKAALKAKKLTKLKNLGEEVSRFWASITDGYYEFQAREKHVEILETITKKDLEAFFNEYVCVRSLKSARIVLCLNSQAIPDDSKVRLLLSVNNFLYKHDLSVDSDKVEAIVEKKGPLDEIKKELLEVLEKGDFPEEKIGFFKKRFVEEVAEMVKTSVPEGYPTAKSVSSVEEFRKTYPKGGIPQPVEPLVNFYYKPEDHAHL